MAEETRDLSGIGRHPDQFEAFYRQHVEAVQRFVARRVADPHLVADLTAEVFLAVIRSAHVPPGWSSKAGVSHTTPTCSCSRSTS